MHKEEVTTDKYTLYIPPFLSIKSYIYRATRVKHVTQQQVIAQSKTQSDMQFTASFIGQMQATSVLLRSASTTRLCQDLGNLCSLPSPSSLAGES